MGAGSNRTVWRWLAVGSALVGCAALVSAAGALGLPRPVVAVRIEHVGDSTVRILQMNLCNSGDARCYTGRSVAEATAVIAVESPDVVTLNEVREGDVAVLERVLVATTGLRVGSRRTIDMAATDHPGLLVTLALAAAPAAVDDHRAPG